MADTQALTHSWQRRAFMKAAATLSLLTATSPTLLLSGCAQDDAPTDKQRDLMKRVSEIVLPRTETKGAGDVGAGDFVILALAHGLDGARKPLDPKAAGQFSSDVLRNDGSLRHVKWLETELNTRAKGHFIELSANQQTEVLFVLDQLAFAEGAGDNPWKLIKGLILTGYYTSEEGGSNELRYELVPGRWDPDIPLKPGDRAWSSDWTAVEFG